jgi:hypothetical protein
MEMALKLYTAVANPITLDGRTRIARGCLRNTDHREALRALATPTVVVQGTEDMLVSAANADVLLEGRAARHVWSHEHEAAAAQLAPAPAPLAGGAEEGGAPAAVAVAAAVTGGGDNDDALHNPLLQPRAIAHLLVRAPPVPAPGVTCCW